MAVSREDTTELRLEAPNSVVSVLDGVSIAQHITRNQLLLRVITEYTDARRHEATVLARLGQLNPAEPESGGTGRRT